LIPQGGPLGRPGETSSPGRPEGPPRGTKNQEPLAGPSGPRGIYSKIKK